MANSPLTGVVRHIYRLAGLTEPKGKTDGELLRDFTAGNDQAAFGTLVERHGTMVLRVCRQVLGHAEDAEDAFQATFLVLARKVASLRVTGDLGGWLRGIAFRIALQAKRNECRRLAREGRCRPTAPANPAAEVAWREVQLILNEEIEQLPEKYRMPFVYCCVEGYSRADVAARSNQKLDLRFCL